MSVNLSELFPPSGGSSGGGDCNIPILDSPPANPELGEQWFSSTDGYLYIWYGNEWVAIGGAGGGSTPEPEPDIGDPYFTQTTLLMNFDDEERPWKDDGYRGGVTFNPINDPATSDVESKHGGRSLALNVSGSGNSRLEVTGLPVAHLVNACTVEMWIYPTASSGTSGTTKRTIFHGSPDVRNKNALTVSVYGSNIQVVTADDNGNLNNYVTTGGLISLNTWHHIAFVRDANESGQLRLYINGVLAGAEAVIAGASACTEFEIGCSAISNANKFAGYIDDVRITDGVVRYSGESFDPPSELPTAGTRNLMLEERSMDNDADLP